MISKELANLFYKSTLFLPFLLLLITSWNAPMSGDEYVHVKQAEQNINYLKAFGEDKEALDTPISRLKHYGQSFDTLTTFITQVFEIENLYRFRHLSNAIVAWFTVLFAALVALKISKSKIAAGITVILFLVSLRFMGHAMNNLKDIPFAFSFIFSLYFLFGFLDKMPKISWDKIVFMVVGLAFGISIRIGGLLIFAYYLLFTGLYIYHQFVSGLYSLKGVLKLILKLSMVFTGIFVVAYFSSILIWPWALENPMKNPWISLEMMHHYPTTIRQVFEGKLYWSDHFPWYYLFKYLLITLPLIVLLGMVLSLVNVWRLKESKSVVFSLFLLISFGFPFFYASVSGANVYGGWRQMLFAYPPLVSFSAIGLWMFLDKNKSKRHFRTFASILALALVIGPVKFFITNYPYQYTFFNQLIGGVEGAYGKYELDYYFTSFKKAYEFIEKQDDDPKIVAANFIIPEYYKDKSFKPALIDYYDRSSVDWDYAVICNTFLDPYQLRKRFWPPSTSIHVEELDRKPILAILKRRSKSDLEGKLALDVGNYAVAIEKLNSALADEMNNESIRLNLARAYLAIDELSLASSTLDYFDEIYPDYEWANELRGEIEVKKGDLEQARMYFEKNIAYNIKFFHSYINLAKVHLTVGNEDLAIDLLKSCLRINPFYEPAYHLYGELLINRGDEELGRKMLDFSISGSSKYGEK